MHIDSHHDHSHNSNSHDDNLHNNLHNNSRLVYSTASGRLRQSGPPAARHNAGDNKDGIVRIQRQRSGRKGKGVCIISGINADDASLKQLAAELKKHCGCGGAVKQGCIEIQGDKRELLQTLLQAKGMTVKLAGG